MSGCHVKTHYFWLLHFSPSEAIILQEATLGQVRAGWDTIGQFNLG